MAKPAPMDVPDPMAKLPYVPMTPRPKSVPPTPPLQEKTKPN